MYTQLRRARQDARTEDGFTLIELLITVVILGVLAGIVVFGVSGINDQSRASACRADKKNVEVASEAFYANANPHDYAASINALVSAGFLREAPSSSNGYTISYNGTTGAVTASGACS